MDLRLSVNYLKTALDFLLDEQQVFSLQEKVNLVLAGFLQDNDLKKRILTAKLKQNDYGSFFDLGRCKFYFDVDGDISNNLEKDPELSCYESIVWGVCKVIFESFIFHDFLDKSAQPANGDIALEIGAYIGSTALLISDLIGDTGKAYAFEPVTWSSLSFNMRANNCSNVEVIPKGVSDSDGEALIHVLNGGIGNMCTDTVRDYTRGKKPLNSATTNGILEHSAARVIELTSIDNFCQHRRLDRVDYIKLDVEGMEQRALYGAESTIQEHHPKWSIDSNHIDPQGEPQHPKLVELLESFDYRIKERTQNAHIWAY